MNRESVGHLAETWALYKIKEHADRRVGISSISDGCQRNVEGNTSSGPAEISPTGMSLKG